MINPFETEKFLTVLVSTYHFKVEVPNIVNYVLNDFKLKTNYSEDDVELEVQETEIWNYLGLVFKRSLINRPFFIYEEPYQNATRNRELSALTHITFDNFFTSLWFVKDNSCNISSMGQFYYNESKEHYASTLSGTYSNSNAKAEFEDVTFTIEEILEADQMFKLVANFQKPRKTQTTVPEIAGGGIMHGSIDDYEYNEYSRVDRAYNFLRATRYSTNLPQKVSNYILILECLFAPGEKTEILYKLSDRVALYAGKNQIERKRIYNLVKDGYNVRSRFVHGDELDRSHRTKEQLKILSVDLDNLVREIFKKVLMEDGEIFLQESGALSKWFNELKFNNY